MVRRLEVVLERHRTVPIVTDEDAPDDLAILSNRDVRVLVVPAGVVGPHLQRDVDGRRIVRHVDGRSEEHTSELQSRQYVVCRLLLEKKKEFELNSARLRTS